MSLFGVPAIEREEALIFETALSLRFGSDWKSALTAIWDELPWYRRMALTLRGKSNKRFLQVLTDELEGPRDWCGEGCICFPDPSLQRRIVASLSAQEADKHSVL